MQGKWQLYCLEPDYLIPTIEFIISSFCFMSITSGVILGWSGEKADQLSGDKLSHTNLQDF